MRVTITFDIPDRLSVHFFMDSQGQDQLRKYLESTIPIDLVQWLERYIQRREVLETVVDIAIR